MKSRFFDISSEWETGMSLDKANEKDISAQLVIGSDVIRMFLSRHYHNGVELYIKNQYGEDNELIVHSLPSKTEIMIELTQAYEDTFNTEQGWEETIPSHFIVGASYTGLSIKTDSLMKAIEDLNLWVLNQSCGKYGDVVYLEEAVDGNYLICWYLERDVKNDEMLLEFERELSEKISRKVEQL